MTAQIMEAFTKILLMIAFGFVLTRLGIIDGGMKKVLSSFLMKAVLPMNIISSAGQAFSAENGRGMLEVLLISAIYYLVTLLFFGWLTKKKQMKDSAAVFINLAVFANVGFIGFPLLGEMLGEVGTLYTVAYNMSYQIFFFTYGIYLLKSGEGFSVRGIFQNTILYFSIGSIALYFSRLRFPDVVQSAISSVGSMMIPVSMIIIGYEIGAMKFSRLYKDKMAYLVSLIRLLIAPLLMLLAMKLLGVQHDVAIAATVLTALPSGSLTVIAAEEQGLDTSTAACAVAQSTILMIITLPILTMAAEMIL